MQIKELSERTGASIRSIRHYEAKGLLHADRRSNGYRDYDETAVATVQTIRLYLGLGLNTENVARIIDCPLAPAGNRPLCQEAYQLYVAKHEQICQQIQLLQRMKAQLAEKIAAFPSASANPPPQKGSLPLDY